MPLPLQLVEVAEEPQLTSDVLRDLVVIALQLDHVHAVLGYYGQLLHQGLESVLSGVRHQGHDLVRGGVEALFPANVGYAAVKQPGLQEGFVLA